MTEVMKGVVLKRRTVSSEVTTSF